MKAGDILIYAVQDATAASIGFILNHPYTLIESNLGELCVYPQDNNSTTGLIMVRTPGTALPPTSWHKNFFPVGTRANTLKAGDIVKSTGNNTHVYKIVSFNGDGNQVNLLHEQSGAMFSGVDRDKLSLAIDTGRNAHGSLCIAHDWKRVDLFRTTEFHCKCCPAVRPFDKEKDEAS